MATRSSTHKVVSLSSAESQRTTAGYVVRARPLNWSPRYVWDTRLTCESGQTLQHEGRLSAVGVVQSNTGGGASVSVPASSSPPVHEFTGPLAITWHSPRTMCLGERSCDIDDSVVHTRKHGSNKEEEKNKELRIEKNPAHLMKKTLKGSALRSCAAC